MASTHEAAGANPSQVSGRKPRRLRVVIVEDDPIIAMELELLLEELEAEVIGIAINAADALAHIRAHDPDLVTMDINIGGDCDGVTLAKEIFEEYSLRSIFVSAHGDAVTQRRAEPCNPIGWIVKPVRKSDLAELMTHVVFDNA